MRHGILLRILAGYFLAQVAFIFLASDAYLLRVDDAFYYFGIARRVVDASMFSFDGIHLTNGFQALWQFLLIGVTYLARLFGINGADQLLYVYFVVCAILNTISAYVAIDLARRFYAGESRQVSIFIFVALWFPGLTSSLLTGMENSLNWMLLLMLARLLVEDDGAVRLPVHGTRRFVGLVMVSTLCVYARLDNAIIIAIIALYFLLRRRQSGTLITVLAWGGLTLAAVAPLFYWQWSNFGAFMPISGSVKMWKTARDIQNHGLGAHALQSIRALVLSAAGLPISAAFMGYYETVKPTVIAAGLVRVVALAGVTALVVIGSLVTAWRRGLLRFRRTAPPPALAFLFTVAAVHIAISSALFPEQWAYAGLIWYFLIENMVIFLAAGWLGGMLLERMRPASWTMLRRVAVVVWVLSIVPLIAWRPQAPTEQQLKRIGARWMNDNLPADAVAAAYNAGVTGYFASVTVVNIDGLVNDRRFFDEYLTRGRVRQYLADEGITHLADHSIPETTPQWYQRWIHIPDEGQILFRRDGNEAGLNFGVVRIDSLSLEATRP